MKKFLIFLSLVCMFSLVSGQENVTENITENIPIVSVTDFEMTNFLPDEVNIGDNQFNIQIKNTGNTILENIIPLITGYGFSTYETITIETLEPNEDLYIILLSHLRESGNIVLKIKIQNKTFYQNISVIDKNATQNEEKLKEYLQQQKEKEEALLSLSLELKSLKEKYSQLQNEVSNKSALDYDVSKINLNEFKRYLRTAESNIFVEDTENAKINLNFAQEEYQDQKSLLDSAKTIPFIYRIKDNSLIFTTIAGALIMMFTLYELLKRKQESLVEKMQKLKEKNKELKEEK